MQFRLATPTDDAALRHILRMEALPGAISLATTREPSYFAAGDALGREHTVVAVPDEMTEYGPVAKQNHAVGMCYWRDHRVHVQGRAVNAHYLGGLRVLPSHQRRLAVLKGGFAAVRRHGPASPAIWYTSIAVGNANARRLLEKGLSGLPRYLPLGRVWTLALQTPRHRNAQSFWSRVSADQVLQWCDAHNQHAADCQFSAAVDVAYIQALNIPLFAHWQGGAMVATLAIWPQNTFKQVRVMRYGMPLRQLRPLVNAWGRLTGRAPLPAAGQALDASFVAFWASAPQLLRTPQGALDQQLRAAAALSASPWLFAGVPADAPLGVLAQEQRYETMIYQVLFDGDEPLPASAAPIWPEVAWL